MPALYKIEDGARRMAAGGASAHSVGIRGSSSLGVVQMPAGAITADANGVRYVQAGKLALRDDAAADSCQPPRLVQQTVILENSIRHGV